MERSDDSTPASSSGPGDSSGETPDLPAVAEALSDCVREALEQGTQADVPGLGTFRIEHRASEMQEPEEGRLSVTPPRDEIVFSPADGEASA